MTKVSGGLAMTKVSGGLAMTKVSGGLAMTTPRHCVAPIPVIASEARQSMPLIP
jgi:hypothetical protein